jgi:hypothetical protein
MENIRRQRNFITDMRAAGYKVVSGLGKHPSNDWPGEESCLILGLDFETATALGAELEQNALIWCGVDFRPELVLLR